VQTFLPSPMATATAMYHTGINPLRGVRHGASDKVEAVKGLRQRRLHKAFLRYHDPDNWPLLRDSLKQTCRAWLTCPRPDPPVPATQPADTGKARTGKAAETRRPVRRTGGTQRFTTKGVPFPKK